MPRLRKMLILGEPEWRVHRNALYQPFWLSYKYKVILEICTRMFTAVSFIIAKIWKQSRWPSVGEWISKLRYIQIMDYYSAIQRHELWSHEKAWRNLKCIWLCERSQSKKATHGLIPTKTLSLTKLESGSYESSSQTRPWFLYFHVRLDIAQVQQESC